MEEPYMGEEIPLRWLLFEKALAADKINYMTLDQTKELTKPVGMESEHELLTMLTFYHDLGYIVYYGGIEDQQPHLRDMVILNPQWLIDVFKQVITILDPAKRDGIMSDAWTTLQKDGILEDRLIQHMWQGFLEHKEALVELMAKFDLICEAPVERLQQEQQDGVDTEVSNETEKVVKKRYYVPSRLTSHCPPGEIAQIKSSTDFYVDFQCFLPVGLFHRLMVRAVRWMGERDGEPVNLFHRHISVMVDEVHHALLEMLPPREATIKVTVFRGAIAGSDHDEDSNEPPAPSAVKEVKDFVTETLDSLIKHWARRIKYDVRFLCPFPTCSEKKLLKDCYKGKQLKCGLHIIATAAIKSKFEGPAVALSQPSSTKSPAVAPSQPSSTERDPTIIFDSSQPSDEDFANESRKSFTPTQLDTGKVTINMKSAKNVVVGNQQITNIHYHGSKREETGEGAGGHSSGHQPQKTSHQEMEFEADDARLSSHQPEVKLDKIMMKMADLTVKDSSGRERAFHETKAREHEGCHLGGGSFGDVFKAIHTVHDDVAVKLAKPGKRDQLVMYKKEAGKHVLALTSNHIVSIKGFVQCEDDACNCGLIGIVMEYMKHGSLWDFRISKWQDRPDPWPLTNMMVYQISSGMHFLHSNNIIHRDLKLENVLVDGNLHVKVADLGLATNLQTSFGDKCWGTDSHKPPEAFRIDLPNSTKVVTREYDVYCFAMTLYELLTGIHPYSDRGFDMLKVLKVEAKQSPCLQPVPVSTPEDLIRVMEKSWSYEPNDRPNFKEIKDWVKKLVNHFVSIQES